MTFRGCFPLFSKIRQIFSGSFLLIGKVKLDETYILKSALKCNSFDVAIGIEIPFFTVFVTIEPGRSLLRLRHHELFDIYIHSPIVSPLELILFLSERSFRAGMF